MPSTPLLLGFIAASLIVLLTPGPGVLYVVARSVEQGYRAGLASVLGLSAGAFLHVIAATVGLSALLLTSATAFGIVKTLGAAYLIYLGLRALFARSSRGTGSAAALTPLPATRLFADGVVISLFNPKIAIFFLAFLPQFVDPAAGSVTQQVFLLGTLYVALALITDGGYALLAGGLRHWVSSRLLQGPWLRRLSGCLYVGLGVKAALARQQP